MKNKLFLILISILILILVFFVFLPYSQNQKEIKRYAFTMDSAEGKVSLSDFKGKYAIVYFGYMYCPDICPTTLSLISQSLHKLKSKYANKFQIIFISVDPGRDKVKELKEYANYFYPSAIGLTSNEKYLKQVTSNYGTYYAKEYQKGSKIDYSVAHTSFVYIMGKDGKLLKRFPHLQNDDKLYSYLNTLR